jgi:hypothetical protein
MNQKGIKLSQLINQPLSDEDSNKINQIIKNKEANPLDKYTSYENNSDSWESMQRLLNLDTTEKDHTRKWIGDEVIRIYFKKYLAEMDQKRCQEDPEQNCSVFFSSFFWQCLPTIMEMFLDGQGSCLGRIFSI